MPGLSAGYRWATALADALRADDPAGAVDDVLRRLSDRWRWALTGLKLPAGPAGASAAVHHQVS